MRTALILGAGPAGSQCALWLKMLGCDVVIAEISGKAGGLQTQSPYINDWMIGLIDMKGSEVALNIEKHLTTKNIPIFYNSSISNIRRTSKGFKAFIGDKEIEIENIVIATGVRPRKGDLVESETVIIGPGIKIDGYSFKNKKVAIFGGGDNAAENYSFIDAMKPRQCHLYAKYCKARYSLWNKVDPSSVFIGSFHVDQKNMSVFYNDQIKFYDVFVVLYGWEANIPDVFLDFEKGIYIKDGFIKTDLNKQTNIPNVYAIGEVSQCRYPCVVTCMADGIVAAKSIQVEIEKTINYI